MKRISKKIREKLTDRKIIRIYRDTRIKTLNIVCQDLTVSIPL